MGVHEFHLMAVVLRNVADPCAFLNAPLQLYVISGQVFGLVAILTRDENLHAQYGDHGLRASPDHVQHFGVRKCEFIPYDDLCRARNKFDPFEITFHWPSYR